MSTNPSASNPGFGYLFISLPYIAQFQVVGQYFHVSYLPKSLERLEDQKVCVWLGPGNHYSMNYKGTFLIKLCLEYVDIEMLVFLIWPGKGVISFGTA